MKSFLITFVLLLCSTFGFAQTDIAVEEVTSTPTIGYKGDVFFLTTTVANLGSVEAKSYYIYYYVSTSPTFNRNTATQVGSSYGASLYPGSSGISHSFNFVFPTYLSNYTTRTWYVWAEIVGPMEPDSAKANNIKSCAITIYGSSY